jgi:hypothetical protein
MARPAYTHGIFQLDPKVNGRYNPPGDALEKFTDVKTAVMKLAELRKLAELEKRNPYDIVVLPLGVKGEGLLPLGV